MKIAAVIERALQSVARIMAIIAAIVLAVMMLLTVGDVFGRYFLNSPIPGAWEITGVLLVCAGTWGLGYCQTQKGHISITVLLRRFTRRIQAVILSVAYMIGFAVFSSLCWQALLMTKRYLASSEGYVTLTLEIPLYPFAIMLAIAAGMMSLILLVDLAHSLAEVVRK